MNDEIKEILEFIDIRIYPPNSLLFNKWKQLKDYITNLQQENYELNRMCELYGKSLYNAELKDYKSRCEKASKYVKDNKVKAYAPYGDNEDTDYEICLVEKEINDLLNILQNGSDNE